MTKRVTTAFLMTASMLMLVGSAFADDRTRDLRRDDRWDNRDRDRRDVRERERERERREAIARRAFLERQRLEALQRQRYEQERLRIERERYRNNGYYGNNGAYGNSPYYGNNGAYGNNPYYGNNGVYGNNGYGIGRGQSGYGNNNFAYQRGYNTGLESGQDDLRRGRPFNPSSHDHYNDGDSGYNSSMGNKAAYVQSYRAGWMAGYQQSYGGRY